MIGELHKQGLLQSTLVIVSAKHGQARSIQRAREKSAIQLLRHWAISSCGKRQRIVLHCYGLRIRPKRQVRRQQSQGQAIRVSAKFLSATRSRSYIMIL